jgi:transcriptional regulator with XRE-family HTH domain
MPDTTAENVGNRLRATRRLLGRTLKEVAVAADVSESFLSQLERGKASASIVSLERITSALGLSMSELFGPNGERPQRLLAADRPELMVGDGAVKHLVTPAAARQMEVFVLQLASGCSIAARRRETVDAEELVLVLAGTVTCEVGPERFELSLGDSVTFRSDERHRISNARDMTAEVVWVISPPTD